MRVAIISEDQAIATCEPAPSLAVPSAIAVIVVAETHAHAPRRGPVEAHEIHGRRGGGQASVST